MTYLFPDLCIVCEGERDRVVLAEIAARLLNAEFIKRRLEIVVANGKIVIPRLVQAAEARFSPDSLIVVVDSDGRPAATKSKIRRSLSGDEPWIVVADPDLESWVVAGRGRKLGPDQLRVAAAQADLSRIESRHPEFRTFREAVTSFPLAQ